MVNNQNPYMKLLPGLPEPPEDGDDRLIGRSVLWPLDELQAIARRSSDVAPTLRAITQKCRTDIKRLMQEPGGFDLAQHVLLLRASCYDKSLWCRSSPDGRVPGFWLPCDAYRLTVPFAHPMTGWEGKANYYFKMAKAPTGGLVLFVSVHP